MALVCLLPSLVLRPATAGAQPRDPGPDRPASEHDHSLLTDPVGDASAELARGEALLKLGDYQQAALAFNRVLVFEPQNATAMERLRRAMVQAGRADLVPDITAELAALYLALGNREVAAERFAELLVIDPEHPQRQALARGLGRIDPGPEEATSIWSRLRSALGILVLLALMWLLSNNRRRVRLRIVLWGIGIQVVLGLFIMRTSVGHLVFGAASDFVNQVLSYTDDGAGFIFGNLTGGITGSATAGPVMYTDGVSGDLRSLGVIFAFHVLPTIIFFGALMSVLYHLGIIQRLVRGIAWGMQRLMGVSGAESLSTAGNIFVGQTEAPLLIKPYVSEMTMSELMAVMCGGFATVSGGVLAAYARFGIDVGHLLTASVMSAPAALVVAKILFPETGTPTTASGSAPEVKRTTANVIDAAAAGAGDGLKLALNVGAMLLAFIALVALLNGLLGWVGDLFGIALSLKAIFGVLFYPLSWAMGVDTKDLLEFGNLLGSKVAVNEFVAYVELGAAKANLSPRSFAIGTYALCGFANFSSIGIQIGGISSIAPERRGDLARIGLKAMMGGAAASWLTACVAGIFL